MKRIVIFFTCAIATLCMPFQTYSQKLESIFLSASENRSIAIQKNSFNTSLKSTLGLSDVYCFRQHDSAASANRTNTVDAQGYTHIRYLQYYKGIKVEHADIRAHFRGGDLYSVNGEYIKAADIDTSITLSKHDAVKKAKLFFADLHVVDTASLKSYYQTPKMVICNNRLHIEDTLLHVAFKIDLYSTEKFVHEYVYVEAKNGEILDHVSLIMNDNGTAATRYSGTRQISTKRNGTDYVLIDTTRGNGIKTYNMHKGLYYNLSSATDFTDNDNNWTYAEYHNSNKDDGALDAHWGAMMTYDYFKQVHGRNSYDDNNSSIKNYVHSREITGLDWDNAAWLGAQNVMIYGDGSSFDILTSIDIIGHEISHGVCQYSAGLVYQGESGAINEALSDIWGACIEKWATSNKQTWLCGEDIGTPIRSMSNPKLYGCPDTYRGNCWVSTSSNIDNGGVHSNSGVMNYWFYLLSEGGTGTNDNGWNYSVTGITIDSAAKIVYRAETIYMTGNTDYIKARDYTIKAAQDIFGANSSKVQSVKDAWYAVGVYNDLYVRDTVTDNGSMPSSCYSTWDSPDIEVVDTLGHKVANLHGNTKYAVRVRIHNRRNVASSGTERLFLNWAKAGFNDEWDEYWTSDHLLSCGAPKGGVIGSANGKIIPSIPANSYRIDTIHWITPAGEDYANCTDFSCDQWHFCLLARIHDDDTIAHEYEHKADVHQLVKNHNNVAQKNVYLDSAENYINTLSIGNVHTIDISRIICLSPKVIGNIGDITNYAEVYITFDAGLLAAINSANISGLTWVNSNTLRWNGGNACIPVTLPANSYYIMMTTVHFLADQIPATNNFDFDMVLRNAAGDSILGGEHYQCIRTNGRYFQAVAHDDMTILWGETASLYATDILETAEYKWYDDQGNEVGDGLTCNVSPQQNTNYTLRVTADADGYRAYSTVTVMVVDGELRMLAPNPADNQVRIGYALSRNVSAATLQILNGSGQVVYTQALSGGNGSKVTGEAIVNTSYLAAGSYTVRLVSSNGKVHDSKTLVVR